MAIGLLIYVNMILYLYFNKKCARVIPSFRPRFAGKCDQQSRDLTQLTSSYISRLNRLLITPDHDVRTHTWKSIAQQIFNGEYEYFLSFTKNRSRIPLHPSRTRSPLSYVSYKYDMYHVISCLACEVHGSSIFRDQKLSK